MEEGNKKQATINIEKLKLSLDIARDEYKMHIDRLRNIDNKLNMLLVFVAGLLTCLNIVLPYSEDSAAWQITASNVLLIQFGAVVLISVVSIMIGFYPRQIKALDERGFVDGTAYNKTDENFYGGYIGGYSESIKTIDKKCKDKTLCLNIAFGGVLVSFFLLVALIAIKLV